MKQIKQVLETDGKFNLSVDLKENSPELRNFKKLINSFSALIQNAKRTRNDANQLSVDVSGSTQSICTLLNQNTEQVNLIATSIEEMSVTNSDLANRAVSSTQIASNAASSVTEAKNTIENVSSEIKQLNTELNDTSETISRLSEMCNEIDSAMAAIKSISDQTNLLALNAAIESARAG